MFRWHLALCSFTSPSPGSQNPRICLLSLSFLGVCLVFLCTTGSAAPCHHFKFVSITIAVIKWRKVTYYHWQQPTVRLTQVRLSFHIVYHIQYVKSPGSNPSKLWAGTNGINYAMWMNVLCLLSGLMWTLPTKKFVSSERQRTQLVNEHTMFVVGVHVNSSKKSVRFLQKTININLNEIIEYKHILQNTKMHSYKGKITYTRQ